MTKSNHGLRTTGTHTGNFGRAKVQGKRGDLDLTKEILNREALRIPPREAAYQRLQEAYEKTTDPRLKRFLAEELKRRHQQTLREPVRVIPGGTPVVSYGPDLEPSRGKSRLGDTDWGSERDLTYEYIHRAR